MLKLIHADFYKIFHRAYFYVLMLSVAAISVVLIFTLRSATANMEFRLAIDTLWDIMVIPVMLLPLLTSIVLDEEYREHVLKNTVSYGTNRFLLYTAKFFTSILLGILMLVFVLICYLGSAWVFLPHGTAFGAAAFQEFLIRIAAVCTVYFAALAMTSFCSTLFSRNTIWMFLFYAGFYLADNICKLFRIPDAIPYLLKSQIPVIAAQPIHTLGKPVLISIVTMAVFFGAGFALFRRKDV